MPLFTPERLIKIPSSWRAFGHSWLNVAAGTFDQTGRIDGVLRNALGAPLSNWTNAAVNGSKITWSGTSGTAAMHGGGWTTAFYETQTNPAKIAPYSAYGGAALMLWGQNDLGHMSNTTQTRASFIHAHRACISRARAGTVKPHTDASIAYGAGFTSVTATDQSTTGTLRRATTTTTATVTITIPADYNGETIGLGFIGKPGTTGGTITFSGTAGLTGTFSTSNINPAAPIASSAYVAATNGHSAMVRRYVAPVTGATQTIICTVTAIDGSGQVDFDSWWLESLAPPPVIVCNVPRIPLAGQTGTYVAWSTAQPTEANRDADVAAWNADLETLRAEFDSMVQIADIHSAVTPITGMYAPDNLHPNERGASKCVDAILAAIDRLVPTSASLGRAASLAPPALLAGPARIPHVIGSWHSAADAADGGTTYVTAVAGDMYAIPFPVTESNVRFGGTAGMAVELGTAVPTASTIIQLAVYSDLNCSGYPQRQVGVFGGSGVNLGTVASAVITLSPTAWEPDCGLHWLVLKVMSIGATAANFRTVIGPSPHMPLVSTSGAGSAGPAIAWKLTGQPVGSAMASLFPAGGIAAFRAPYIGLKRLVAG